MLPKLDTEMKSDSLFCWQPHTPMCPQETRLQLMCSQFLMGMAPKCQSWWKGNRGGVVRVEMKSSSIFPATLQHQASPVRFPWQRMNKNKEPNQGQCSGGHRLTGQPPALFYDNFRGQHVITKHGTYPRGQKGNLEEKKRKNGEDI